MRKLNINAVKIWSVAIIVAILAAAPAAFGAAEDQEGWKLIPRFMYMTNNSNNNGSTSSSNRFLADGAFGYHFSGPFFLGAQYDYDNTSNGGGSSTTISGVGPTAGYMATNFFFLVSYYVTDTEADVNGNATTTYTGNGFQIDLSYVFDVGASWSLGPVMSYRSLQYNSVSPGGSTNYSHSTLLPYIGVVIGF